MPRKQIKRKCGHIENIYLEDREFNDPAALKHHNVTEIFPCILCEYIINLLSLLPHPFIFYCTQFTQR